MRDVEATGVLLHEAVEANREERLKMIGKPV